MGGTKKERKMIPGLRRKEEEEEESYLLSDGNAGF